MQPFQSIWPPFVSVDRRSPWKMKKKQHQRHKEAFRSVWPPLYQPLGQFGLNRDIEDDKVIDHCHYSGKFLNFAHPDCNINRKTTNFIPVIAHNSSN